jgi:flagellar hook assembly protein FlgD
LYAVNGEVDLNNYELPPMPPAGMFDVRYGSQRMAEVIGSKIQTIEMSGIEYPVTVKVEGMTIRVQDETGKIVNAVLKSGEDLVINNPMVEKLKVSGNTIPERYSLEQNYPNPFNPSTMIEFSIPEDIDNVKLTIYDALGQKVSELVNGKLEAGHYSYQWDASKVASGLYIYQLKAKSFISAKKMLLLK